MPIKFRCPHCRQFLGISRSKANSVTDCPTCGRTIRIPNLDGKVAAIPKPKLDLQDSELIRALGALASIDESSPEEEPLKSSQQPDSSEPAQQQPAVRPQIIDVLEREAPITILVDAEEQQPSAQEDEQQRSSHKNDVLAQLAETQRPPSTSRGISSAKGRRFGAGSLLLGCVICLLCGGLIGRALFPRQVVSVTNNTSSDKKTVPPESPSPIIPQEKSTGGFKLTGRLTYTAPTGEALPDREARILILPIERIGTAKLSVAGFRVGASPADQKLLQAELRALQGDFVTADANGHYSAVASNEGRYGVLIASRYQSRSQDLLSPGAIMDFVASYFERPTQLLGKVQYHFQTLAVSGSGETIDHHFELE